MHLCLSAPFLPRFSCLIVLLVRKVQKVPLLHQPSLHLLPSTLGYKADVSKLSNTTGKRLASGTLVSPLPLTESSLGETYLTFTLSNISTIRRPLQELALSSPALLPTAVPPPLPILPLTSLLVLLSLSIVLQQDTPRSVAQESAEWRVRFPVAQVYISGVDKKK